MLDALASLWTERASTRAVDDPSPVVRPEAARLAARPAPIDVGRLLRDHDPEVRRTPAACAGTSAEAHVERALRSDAMPGELAADPLAEIRDAAAVRLDGQR